MAHWTIEELALAYELRQAGCCWKRIAQGLGGDHRLLDAAVSHCVQHGICKKGDGYARQRGRAARFNVRILHAAGTMRGNNLNWRAIGEHLGVDFESLRRAYNYAISAGVITA